MRSERTKFKHDGKSLQRAYMTKRSMRQSVTREIAAEVSSE